MQRALMVHAVRSAARSDGPRGSRSLLLALSAVHRWRNVAIELEIPGVDPLPATGNAPAGMLARSPDVPKRGRRVDVGWSHAFEAPAGSAAAKALGEVLTSGNKASAGNGGRVQFYLRDASEAGWGLW